MRARHERLAVVALERWLSMIHQRVDVPVQALMTSALVATAKQFCRKSQCVIVSQPYDSVRAGQTLTVEPEPHPDLMASEILQLTQLDRLISPSEYCILNRDSVHLLADYEAIDVHYVVEPRTQAQHLPTMLFQEYGDGICAGAASRLQRQAQMPWGDLDMAHMNEQEYYSALREARRMTLEVSPWLDIPASVRQREFF